MGKFDGVLIASDYDNTMAFTEGSLYTGTPPPPVSEKNRKAVEYFMAEGGIFSVSTGRALPAFDAVRADVPMNGPTAPPSTTTAPGNICTPPSCPRPSGTT